MAIGTIDCTVEKKLCNEHQVRGYPTLKFALDGEIYDYPGGRAEKDFLDFSKKMLRPIVEAVASVDAAKHFAANEADDGVAFLAYHPAVTASSSEAAIDEMLQSTRLTQVLAQVARKHRASGSFLLLDPTTTDDDGKAVFAAAVGQEGSFLCRLEADIEPRCYAKVGDEEIQYEQLLEWVNGQNVPTVSALGGHNFRTMTRRGRPLVIAVVNPGSADDEVAGARRELARYAVHGPDAIRDKYYYGWLDGKTWARFLAQFEVKSSETPQVFILDLGKKLYWQNATYRLNIDDFLQAVEDGTVEAKTAGKHGVEGFLVKVYNLMVAYRPWSVVAVVLLLVSFVVLILSCVRPGEDLRPPYPREKKKTEEKKSEAKDESKDDEGKKEK